MRRKIPPLQALTCFEAAAKHESYTRAAEVLFLTQSAVSRQIAALEDYLGTILFKRTRHGVSLTEAGKKYARQVTARLVGLEHDTIEVMTHKGAGDSLHIATVPTFATRWLLPRLADLHTKHPDLTIHLDVRTRPFLFAETTFDAALYAGTADQVNHWPGTQITELLREDVVPVASPSLLHNRKKIKLDEIAQLPLLQSSTRPDAWQQWFEEVGVVAMDANRGPRYELFSMLAVAATQGLGVALLPTILITDEVARGDLVVLSKRALCGLHSYYLVIPDHADQNEALERFRDWLISQAKN
jgi:DNA-binding transcriptional LysR family regulator